MQIHAIEPHRTVDKNRWLKSEKEHSLISSSPATAEQEINIKS